MTRFSTLRNDAYVLSVNISRGGIPKKPQKAARALKSGLDGDGRNHAKHIRPDRAVSLWDHEILERLVNEGFNLSPGAAGENLTVVGLNVQQLDPGTILRIGRCRLRLEQPRKPCYVLDAIDPRLKEVIIGRCGYMASVVEEGTIRPGMSIDVVAECETEHDDESWLSQEGVISPPGATVYHILAGPTLG